MKKKIVGIVLPLILLFPSCSIHNKTVDNAYLNAYYALNNAGDIHNAGLYENELLSNYSGYENYLYLFDRDKSYLNYQCKGTSYDDFYCEGSIYLVDKNDVVLLDNKSFRCRAAVGFYVGSVVFENKEDEKSIGTIHIYTPYWCRIQLPYTIDDVEITMTFEFWIRNRNPLPDFVQTESKTNE